MPVFVLELQEQDNWCWVAVAVSVAKFFNPAISIRQCDLATVVLRSTGHLARKHDCCNAPDTCDQVHKLQDALTEVGHLRRHGPRLPVSDVRREIHGGRPVACRVAGVASGHFVIVDDLDDTDPMDPDLRVVDPEDPANPAIIAASDFCRNYKQWGGCTHTFLVQP